MTRVLFLTARTEIRGTNRFLSLVPLLLPIPDYLHVHASPELRHRYQLIVFRKPAHFIWQNSSFIKTGFRWFEDCIIGTCHIVTFSFRAIARLCIALPPIAMKWMFINLLWFYSPSFLFCCFSAFFLATIS